MSSVLSLTGGSGVEGQSRPGYLEDRPEKAALRVEEAIAIASRGGSADSLSPAAKDARNVQVCRSRVGECF